MDTPETDTPEKIRTRWAEVADPAALEDDAATVFDSEDAFRLEFARGLGLYEPPASSLRGQALAELRQRFPLEWMFLGWAAGRRLAYQLPEDFVHAVDAPRIATSALLQAAVHLKRARDATRAMQALLSRNDDVELETRVTDLECQLSTCAAALEAARSDVSWVRKKADAGALRFPPPLPPDNEPYGQSCAGYVRLVFRDAGIHGDVADVLEERGASRAWTLAGIVLRLKPAVALHSPEFGDQQATWRREVMRQLRALRGRDSGKRTDHFDKSRFNARAPEEQSHA